MITPFDISNIIQQLTSLMQEIIQLMMVVAVLALLISALRPKRKPRITEGEKLKK